MTKTIDTGRVPTPEEFWAFFTKSQMEWEARHENWEARHEKIERQMKETDRKISALGSRIGEIVESMVEGNIVGKFQVFGYTVTKSSRNVKFGNRELPCGEIDLFLEDGDIAILIEVKTTLETADVRNHIDRLERYRRYVDATGHDKRHFIGAVAGAVIMGEAATVAHESGIYVIVQSGEAVEIVKPPEGFKAKKW